MSFMSFCDYYDVRVSPSFGLGVVLPKSHLMLSSQNVDPTSLLSSPPSLLLPALELHYILFCCVVYALRYGMILYARICGGPMKHELAYQKARQRLHYTLQLPLK